VTTPAVFAGLHGGTKVYLLTFNGFRAQITAFLDTRREVLNWFGILSNTILIVSRSNAPTLSNLVHSQFPTMWFLITELDPSTIDGYLPDQAWDFITKPKSSGRWE